MSETRWTCMQCGGKMPMGASAVLGEYPGEVFCGQACHDAYKLASLIETSGAMNVSPASKFMVQALQVQARQSYAKWNPMIPCSVEARHILGLCAAIKAGEERVAILNRACKDCSYRDADPCDDCPIHLALRKLVGLVLNSGTDQLTRQVDYPTCAAAAQDAQNVLLCRKEGQG